MHRNREPLDVVADELLASAAPVWGVWCTRHPGGRAGLSPAADWLKENGRLFVADELTARGKARALNTLIRSHVLTYEARPMPAAEA